MRTIAITTSVQSDNTDTVARVALQYGSKQGHYVGAPKLNESKKTKTLEMLDKHFNVR